MSLTLGRMIRARRETVGILREDLAERMGVSHGHLRNVESDHIRASEELLARLADALGVEGDDRAAWMSAERPAVRKSPPRPRKDRLMPAWSPERRAKMEDYFRERIDPRRSRLTWERTKLGLTATALAAHANTLVQHVVALETGREPPYGPQGWRQPAEDIASYLGIPPEDLWPEHAPEMGPRLPRVPVPTPEELYEATERRALFWRAVATLPTQDRLAITLHCAPGGDEPLDGPTLGEVLSLGRAGVNAMLHRSIWRLRKILTSKTPPSDMARPSVDSPPALRSANVCEVSWQKCETRDGERNPR